MRHKRPASLLNVGIDNDPSALANFSHFPPQQYRFICSDAIAAIRQLAPDRCALIYCDPPYLTHTRRSQRKLYRTQYSEAEHQELLHFLRDLPCMVMISGYPSELYSRLVGNWHRITFNGISHAGRRTEALWMNFRPGGLLHDTRFLGDDFRQREAFKRRRLRWRARLGRLPLAAQQAIVADLAGDFLLRQKAAAANSAPTTFQGVPFSSMEATQLYPEGRHHA